MKLREQIVFSRVLSEDSLFCSGAEQRNGELRERYDSLATLYADAFRKLGIGVICLEAPRIYQTEESLAVLGVTASTPHIAVRPIADFRPVHGLANYLVFDGPIDDLDRELGSTLRSGLQILGEASGVFCTNSLLVDAIGARGLTNAGILVPPTLSQTSSGLDAFGARLRTEVFTS